MEAEKSHSELPDDDPDKGREITVKEMKELMIDG